MSLSKGCEHTCSRTVASDSQKAEDPKSNNKYRSSAVVLKCLSAVILYRTEKIPPTVKVIQDPIVPMNARPFAPRFRLKELEVLNPAAVCST